MSELGPIDPAELKGILDDEGLTVCASHVSYERLRDETAAVVEEHRLWNCHHVAIGGLPAAYHHPAGYSLFAREASAVARRLSDAGLTFSYHNHSFELERLMAARAWSFCTRRATQVFTGELDTYWLQHGGGVASVGAADASANRM